VAAEEIVANEMMDLRCKRIDWINQLRCSLLYSEGVVGVSNDNEKALG
jgi:hypothetical protein